MTRSWSGVRHTVTVTRRALARNGPLPAAQDWIGARESGCQPVRSCAPRAEDPGVTKVRPARWASVALACGLAAACSSKPVEMRAQLSTATTNGWPSPTTVPRPTTTDAPANAPASKPGYIPSASTLVLTADNDALSEGWAHIDVTTSGQGHYADYSEDSGPAIGHQMITIDGAHAEAIVIGGVAYARGDAAAVVNLFGLP